MVELDIIIDDKYKDRYIYDIKDNNISIGTIIMNKDKSTKDIQEIFDNVILNIKQQKREIKMNELEQEKAIRLIDRHYLESLILREMRICLIKSGYKVGIYTFCGGEPIFNIIKNIYNDKLFGEPFSANTTNNDNIIVDFNNGSIIKILNCYNEERGNRFDDVLVNKLIPQKDVNEIIKPKVITIQKPIEYKMFYYEL